MVAHLKSYVSCYFSVKVSLTACRDFVQGLTIFISEFLDPYFLYVLYK